MPDSHAGAPKAPKAGFLAEGGGFVLGSRVALWPEAAKWAGVAHFLFGATQWVVPGDAQTEQLRTIAARVAASHGLDVFDVQLRRQAIGWVLRVVIDRPTVVDAQGAVVVETTDRGIGIDECQLVSQDLGAVLDVEDVIAHEYTLEVSSPGIDRPLRGPTDYQRFAGRLAKIVVTEAVDGQMHFEGRLEGLDAGDVVIAIGRKTKRIPFDRISRARLAVEF